MQTKIIAMLLLVAIATIGAIGIGIGMGIGTTQAFCGFNEPFAAGPRGCDDTGQGQSLHDFNGDVHSHGHA